MVVGEKTRFYIPSSLGYGNKPAGKIGAGALLIFDVELLAIN
jgi:peptidylprolyl isomerase